MVHVKADLSILQREVQRKLGRCLLRLQQYERLLKAVVANSSVDGPIEHLQAARAQREEDVSNQTLGELKRTFIGSYLTSTAGQRDLGASKSGQRGHSARSGWASIRFTIQMAPKCHEQTAKGLAELVALRNDQVHHLIERFDLSQASGCLAASSQLDSCYERIDGNCQLLKTWANGLAAAHAITSSYVQSKAFEDAFVHGINPDGSVSWQIATIVECLRQAEMACQIDGWTSLGAAINFIAMNDRDQTPSRYGCKTWRQVLNRSNQFALRSVANSDGMTGHTLYRSSTPTGTSGASSLRNTTPITAPPKAT